MTQPQTAFGEELLTDPSFTIASLAGPTYEHWQLNMNDPHLAKAEVREALSPGDRQGPRDGSVVHAHLR